MKHGQIFAHREHRVADADEVFAVFPRDIYRMFLAAADDVDAGIKPDRLSVLPCVVAAHGGEMFG